MPSTAPVTTPDGPREPDAPTLPRARREGRPRRRRLLVVGVVVVALGLLPAAWVQVVGQTHVRGGAADVPAADVVLVPGAGLRPDGTPSTFLRRRLAAAHDLYQRGTVDVVLVSGDSSTEDYDEPTAMRDWLVGLGVPTDRIVLDHAGLDTHDTCVRAHEVFGVRSAVVVTQDYHLRRALFSCRAAGIDVTGLGVASTSVEPPKAVMYRVREVPASVKAAWDAATGRAPAHLGPRETGVQDVLDREVTQD